MEPVVEDLVQPGVTVFANTPLGVCARAMLSHGVRHLPVVDDSGRILGTIEDLDIFRHGVLLGPKRALWLAHSAASDRLQAAQVMKPLASSCLPGTSVWMALHRMASAAGAPVAVNDSEGRLFALLTAREAVRIAGELLPLHWTVGQIMSDRVITMDHEQPAHLATGKMAQAGIRHIVVTKAGRLHGIVSLRDLVSKNVSDHRDLLMEQAIGSDTVFFTSENADLANAAEVMVQRHVGCLPVVSDGDAVIGIVTRTDLLRATLAELESRAFRVPPSGADPS